MTGDDKLADPLRFETGPSSATRDAVGESARRERQRAVDNRNVRICLRSDVVEPTADLCFQSGLGRRRVQDLRPRNLDGGTVLHARRQWFVRRQRQERLVGSCNATYLDRTTLQEHAPSRHNLLVSSRDLEVPGAPLVGRRERDVYAVYVHGHHSQLLEGFIVSRRRPLMVSESIGLLNLGVGACAAKLVARSKVKGIGGRMSVSQATRISERRGVDFHSQLASVSPCMWIDASVIQRGVLGDRVLGRQEGMRVMGGMDKVVSEERAPRSLVKRRRLVVVEKEGRKAERTYRSSEEECESDEISARTTRPSRQRPRCALAARRTLPPPIRHSKFYGQLRPLSAPRSLSIPAQ